MPYSLYMSSLRFARETEPNGSSTSAPSKSFNTKSFSPALSMTPVKLRRPSMGSQRLTFASCPTNRRKCSGLVSGRSIPGEDTSIAFHRSPRPRPPGKTAEATREENSWSTGPSSRSTSSVSKGPPENWPPRARFPQGAPPLLPVPTSPTSPSLSPSSNVKKSNGPEDPLLLVQQA